MAVYRASAHLHSGAGAGVRRQLLALDAARYGDRRLAARIAAVPVEGEPEARWRVDWATGTELDARLRHVLHGPTDGIGAVAMGVVEGRPVAVTGDHDNTVRMWDLTTRRQIGPRLVFPEPVMALAMAAGGRLVVGFGEEVAALSPLT
ncbi:hypothetical protein ACIBAG_37710 [Streptomyces sp. NPDC051243]|uniref:hypothetical protein n=1 Tax=Streptomyces sp. NPDC051243 TaxID=3365646 RepID=UPI0037BDE4A4